MDESEGPPLSRLRWVVAVAAAALLAGGVSGGLAFGLAGRSVEPPPRAIPLEDKQTIEREVSAALAARQKLRFLEVKAHARVAYELAKDYGQRRLAEEIRGVMAGGCGAVGIEFHAMLALRLLRDVPTAAAA